ncbi:YjbF family lipoprotein [Pseudaestuariivita sp.]|uniref:YjbF family lipoprotein n=1 Tax=Pseudaestuariivita sp. TaxID=2211669 RepID=UPI0040590552
MIRVSKLRIAVLSLALGALTACGNEADTQATQGLIKGLVQLARVSQDAPPPAAMTPEDMGRVLAATPNSVMLFTPEKSGQQVPIIQIERNLAYRTYATGGRQAVVVKNGFVTGTRGLGGDLMSADLDQTLNLVAARQEGTSIRKMRFLTGDDQTAEFTFQCTVSRQVSQGGLQGMREACASKSGSFENTFAVNAQGQVLASQQWLGFTNGMASLVLLRD